MSDERNEPWDSRPTQVVYTVTYRLDPHILRLLEKFLELLISHGLSDADRAALDNLVKSSAALALKASRISTEPPKPKSVD